ncbi:Alpha-1,3-mannosyltransferase-like protein [Scheffersomyces spartinae]|uniref:Alpha-1,3/1,6-mannosyltransferase ALG2 n=1 Tax=Scheffersomyces spartinae TaxID=45513 RepID=A0A9P7VDY3_9ASCO|nr:Alpha-1,3-mannosyltransferase-like protein [Scheffersomyces spartinae]KAG7196094.1 Alpha-1,3-mannosyltransferase-like protein [Scheffersomyces spartinae]
MAPIPKTSNEVSIAFIHPDLGIGGAERLVVDAAMGLQDLGNHVDIYTSHCDLSHCFEEVSQGTLKVHVYGDWLPTHLMKKFHIFCAIARQLYLMFKLWITGRINQYDYFIVDQLSICVPFLKVLVTNQLKVLFYCHFPDQLLTKRETWIKSMYRKPFDGIEEYTTGMSDRIVVNSNFTRGMFHNTFKNLKSVDPGVIYPCVDVNQVNTQDEESDKELTTFFKGEKFFLSVNRFERKKNIELAIKLFAKFKRFVPSTKKPKLVIAGGYDARVLENVTYLNELENLCHSLKLTSFTIRGKLIILPPSTDVLFLPSIKTSLKKLLMKNAEMLLYTPSFEHFGIVPVESMLFRTPVLGVNNGGPLESIVSYEGENLDCATGFVRPPIENEWSTLMVKYFQDTEDKIKTKLGDNGYQRVMDIFSREQMSKAFYEHLLSMNGCKNTPKSNNIPFIGIFVILPILLVFLAIYRGLFL